jgi:hypothetical protein
MYSTLLLVHGVLRWLVVAAAIWTLVRPLDKRSGLSLVITLDTQVLLGLLMFAVFSPITKLAMDNMKLAMKDRVLRFWVVEHPFAMLLAVIAVHVGRVLAKKAKDDAARKKRMVIAVVLAIIAIAVGMPWPFMPYGRPLLPH